ncbi:MAG: TerC family protein [Verrucomicrobia bacterium]|nr:TerC family protein [Verrucomicrobiota bacterium]
MFAEIPITPWHWAGFVVAIILFLAVDLGIFHRRAHVVRFREALLWTMFWFLVAMMFAATLAPLIVPGWGKEQQAEFITGYILELSLSMDNVFVIALIFSYFRIPQELQHRVLFWGILGALLMRGLMIWIGTELIHHVAGMFYVFGAFLVFTGFKMSLSAGEEIHPEKNPVIGLAKKMFPISARFDGQKFFSQENGHRVMTPLALVLVMVETTDLLFALDSIPAIFGVTQQSFIVFTSNVFAILGLRSLYFVLAGALRYFHFLKFGLSVVLIFVGIKMLLVPWFKISTDVSLVVVAGILITAMLASIFTAWRRDSGNGSAGTP